MGNSNSSAGNLVSLVVWLGYNLPVMKAVGRALSVSGLRVSIDLDLDLGLDLYLGVIPIGAMGKTRVPRLTRRYTEYSSQLGA